MASDKMSVIIENEHPLPITVSDRDMVAVGVEDGSLPSLDEFKAHGARIRQRRESLDWSGAGADVEREVPSPHKEQTIVVVVSLTTGHST